VAPSSGQSKALLDDLLAGEDAVDVEAAIARLAISGRPGLRQVLQRLKTAGDDHLPRLLRVLERIGDPSALPAVRPLVTHASPEVAAAAVDVLGALLDARDSTVASSALDILTATLLDGQRPDAVRLRALDAITNAPDPSPTYDADIVEPLRRQLRLDASDVMRRAADGGLPETAPVDPTTAVDLDGVAAGVLPADAEAVRRTLAAQGSSAPLTTLHRVIDRVRTHERGLPPEDVEPWRVVRATAHLALAARGSRLAVYDLRETLEALGPQTPVGMLSALQQVGDGSVLDAVADAYAATEDGWFRQQVTTIFRAIVEREKMTKRHAAVKKLSARAPETLAALWG
jgi:hypothetical protein